MHGRFSLAYTVSRVTLVQVQQVLLLLKNAINGSQRYFIFNVRHMFFMGLSEKTRGFLQKKNANLLSSL